MVPQQIECRLGCLAFIAVAVTCIGMKPFRHFKIIWPCESKIKGSNRQPRAPTGWSGNARDRNPIIRPCQMAYAPSHGNRHFRTDTPLGLV